jgi:hypothetical protein
LLRGGSKTPTDPDLSPGQRPVRGDCDGQLGQRQNALMVYRWIPQLRWQHPPTRTPTSTGLNEEPIGVRMEAGRYGGTTGGETARSPRWLRPKGRPIDNQGLLMEAARRKRATLPYSTARWRARQEASEAQPAGSASARACVKSPESRIAFPPTGLPARSQDGLNPLHRDSVQAQRVRSPPVRLFTQSGELFGVHDSRDGCTSLSSMQYGDGTDHEGQL